MNEASIQVMPERGCSIDLKSDQKSSSHDRAQSKSALVQKWVSEDIFEESEVQLAIQSAQSDTREFEATGTEISNSSKVKYLAGKKVHIRSATSSDAKRSCFDDLSDLELSLKNSVVRRFKELPNNNQSQLDQVDVTERELDENVQMLHKDEWIFGIFCSNPDNREKITSGIISLNGSYLEAGKRFHKLWTHLICDRLSPTVKFLSCVAAGKWILSMKYIRKSLKENCFLDDVSRLI